MNFQYEKWKNRDRNTEIDNMTDQKKEIAELLSGMIDGLETGDIESMIEIPPESKLGDYAFPCFKLAKTMKMCIRDSVRAARTIGLLFCSRSAHFRRFSADRKNRGFIFDGSCCDKYSVMIKYFVSK